MAKSKKSTPKKFILKKSGPKKVTSKKSIPKKSKDRKSTIVFECAWEVCNQVGGIYTVIRSKTPAMTGLLQDRYVLIGPYVGEEIEPELDRLEKRKDPIHRIVRRMNKHGIVVHDATWLITGRPRVLLFDLKSIAGQLEEIRHVLWKHHKLETSGASDLINNSLLFGYAVAAFFKLLGKLKDPTPVIAHFHEWQGSVPILFLKQEKAVVKTVFTTHATILGRYLAYSSPHFYDHLPFYEPDKESKHFGIHIEAQIETLSARYADKFTTVSDVTAQECKHLVKQKVDEVLPNGLNITRFVAFHEFQNLHARYKEEIHRFVMGHFFQSYSFDLEKTLYFFSSGRYEFRNKGYDLTLYALDALNKKLKAEKSDITVVFFLVTKRPHHGIKSDVLESRALMEEIRHNCDLIQEQVGQQLFYAGTTNVDHRLPNLNEFVEDYLRLRYRRTIQTWKTSKPPSVVTHELNDVFGDEVMSFLRNSTLDNGPEQRVKIVYHPEFITTTNPLLGIEYGEFVRGCHLGIFPSYYEPWGYTPLECMASGVPSVTSDLSGFGDFALRNIDDHEEKGVFVIERAKKEFKRSVEQLATLLHDFTSQTRRERIMQRNNTENASTLFDWESLVKNYQAVYNSL